MNQQFFNILTSSVNSTGNVEGIDISGVDGMSDNVYYNWVGYTLMVRG